ncbi:unnamed protein product, partial [Lampetra fluviatilis]
DSRDLSHRRNISPIVYDRSEDSGGETDSDSRKSQKEKLPSSVRAVRRDVTSRLRQLLEDAKFFLIKSNNFENVALSKAKGVWSTLPANERKLNSSFRDFPSVILVYSVRESGRFQGKESGRFQGFARLCSESRHGGSPVPWMLPSGLSARALGGVFRVDWLCRQELSFTKTCHLYNPWNDGKPVKIGRDGQVTSSPRSTQPRITV